MKLIDTHSHMYLPQFDEDRKESVERAVAAGVEKIVLPNIDSESVVPLKNLMKQFPENCFGLMGLHPTHAKENYREELDIIFKELDSGTYVGVGEIGIDLYWDKTHLKEQIDAFIQQVKYAIDKGIPFIIHARDSFEEVFQALESIGESKFKGVFHAFTGTKEYADRAIDMGLLLGIGGIVTFKNGGLAEVVSEIDLNHLVLETDSPYLAPTPHRGKRNESSYVRLVAEKIAELKACTVQEVAKITTHNAQSIFGV